MSEKPPQGGMPVWVTQSSSHQWPSLGGLITSLGGTSLGGSIIWSNHLNWFTGHPGKETHFGCLCPWPYSFSHDPRLLAIDGSWEVDWPVNRGSPCGSAPSSRQQIGFPSASLLKLLPSVWWSTSLFDPHYKIHILKLLHLVSDFHPVPGWTLHIFSSWEPWPQI